MKNSLEPRRIPSAVSADGAAPKAPVKEFAGIGKWANDDNFNSGSSSKITAHPYEKIVFEIPYNGPRDQWDEYLKSVLQKGIAVKGRDF